MSTNNMIVLVVLIVMIGLYNIVSSIGTVTYNNVSLNECLSYAYNMNEDLTTCSFIEDIMDDSGTEED